MTFPLCIFLSDIHFRSVDISLPIGVFMMSMISAGNNLGSLCCSRTGVAAAVTVLISVHR